MKLMMMMASNSIWRSLSSGLRKRVPTLSPCVFVSSNAVSSVGNSMTFEEYRNLRKTLKTRSRIAGVPLACVGISISSFVCIQMNPRMFEMTPEEMKPIL